MSILEGIDRLFRLRENGTTIGREALGGTSTFMTMSYIIFVQPAILSKAGMDPGAVMTATCLASALATVLTGLLARYPIAQAPAMGHNFFFAYTVCGAAAAGGLGHSWQVALGAVVVSGLLFVVLSLLGVWEKLVAVIPDSLKYAIAAGIGLLIAFIGLQYGGLVVANPGALVQLGDLSGRPALMALAGLALTAVLMALKVPGAILLGIVATALLGLPLGVVKYQGLVSNPPSLAPTFLQADVLGALKTGLVTVVFIFFLLDVFDAVGTLIGVGGQAGFIKNGRLPRANQAMMADALGTVGGALLGTSTVSSYVESAAGISQGARTGLANMFTSVFFLLALFFSPAARMIGGEYALDGRVLHPAIAPALIVVGYFMMKCVTFIRWDEPTEALPAFLTLLLMPLTLNITEGISVGFISYALLKLVSGRGREVHAMVYVISVLFVLRYLFA
ncbi:MAG: NCS2 family permease [Candidatus Aminicenantes bacterium]|nr:NCS2 family permease [Candidatus Aminicenantes bacterium]